MDELLTGRDIKEPENTNRQYPTVLLIFKSLALSMGVAVIVLTSMANYKGLTVDINTMCSFLGIGITCLAMTSFNKQ